MYVRTLRNRHFKHILIKGYGKDDGPQKNITLDTGHFMSLHIRMAPQIVSSGMTSGSLNGKKTSITYMYYQILVIDLDSAAHRLVHQALATNKQDLGRNLSNITGPIHYDCMLRHNQQIHSVCKWTAGRDFTKIVHADRGQGPIKGFR